MVVYKIKKHSNKWGGAINGFSYGKIFHRQTSRLQIIHLDYLTHADNRLD